jgi:four helix bundle protein
MQTHKYQHREEASDALKDLVVQIYRLSKNNNLKKDRCFQEELRCSALSFMVSITSGRESISSAQFQEYIAQAKASAVKLRAQLLISREFGYLTEGDLLDFKDKINRAMASLEDFNRIHAFSENTDLT